ncbi:class I SAM-dependent methyltransferase [Streptomyces chiangmaiensis]|uniref:Class I SAM-dependent methyltransferase n=1 Tax=Streptomyces chiangmaiensis TaxID=766497 RepID=A0ABU7FTT3_9ACTN|nr:class I SAM-dependent methyltransferase [Streptomyces chiangmaiensis]MED7827242.1 class I SAM-dependent methyltransferase [Streptomyces chiangmaiensis]
MADRAFSDAALAGLYDTLNPWGPSHDFYLGLVMSARRVLDVGCGTGALLARARESGHDGRLCGLDPAAAMLVQARRRATEVEWVLGDLRSHRWQGAFDLVVMTGHAFQELVGDQELKDCLDGVREALAHDGRFVFETRNPGARAWESWTSDRVHEAPFGHSGVVRVRHDVETPVHGDRVTYTSTFDGSAWERPRVSRSTLRFLGPDTLSRFLTGAGLAVLEQYGDWGRGPLTPTSPEIITVAWADSQ